MIYIYAKEEKMQEKLLAYIKNMDVSDDVKIVIGGILHDELNSIKTGDTIIFNDIIDIGLSNNDAINNIKQILEKGIFILVPDYHISITHELKITYHGWFSAERVGIDLSQKIYNYFINNPPKNIAFLGRPIGAKSRSLKLDKSLEEIKNYLSIKIPKKDIALKLGVTEKTLRDYLKKKSL